MLASFSDFSTFPYRHKQEKKEGRSLLNIMNLNFISTHSLYLTLCWKNLIGCHMKIGVEEAERGFP
jgi:hypothetical protein